MSCALSSRQNMLHSRLDRECYIVHTQTCHFDWIQNLNECEKKSECTEKNLNLTTKKKALLNRYLHQIQIQKHLNFESVYLNFTKFQEKI